MAPIVKEITAKSVLSKTGIPGERYCINPYVGCAHACRYCYATFMRRFTGHTVPWGSFVDVKVNAPDVLKRELRRAERGGIIMSSVTDPYQPIESRYMLTRRCLDVLRLFQFPIDILTKSPLVLRDKDILTRLEDVDVGMTITTDNERMRMLFEPCAPPIKERIDALRDLHNMGIRTYAFIGPVLPMNPDVLARLLMPHVDSVLIDRMNYHEKVKWIYKRYKIEQWLDDDFINGIIKRLESLFDEKEVEVC
ncbi:MAG: radical SAM protein [Thermodesulfovibrionia bacterium]